MRGGVKPPSADTSGESTLDTFWLLTPTTPSLCGLNLPPDLTVSFSKEPHALDSIRLHNSPSAYNAFHPI